MGATQAVWFLVQPSALVGDTYAALIIGDAAIALPSGWNSFASGSIGAFNYLVCMKSIVTNDIGGLKSVQLGASVTTWAGLVLGLRGSGGINASGKALVQGNTSFAAPSMTPTVNNATAFALYIVRGGRVFTPPAGFTVDIMSDGAGSSSLLLCHNVLGAASANQPTGTATATVPTSTDGIALQVALPSTLTVQSISAASGG